MPSKLAMVSNSSASDMVRYSSSSSSPITICYWRCRAYSCCASTPVATPTSDSQLESQISKDDNSAKSNGEATMPSAGSSLPFFLARGTCPPPTIPFSPPRLRDGGRCMSLPTGMTASSCDEEPLYSLAPSEQQIFRTRTQSSVNDVVTARIGTLSISNESIKTFSAESMSDIVHERNEKCSHSRNSRGTQLSHLSKTLQRILSSQTFSKHNLKTTYSEVVSFSPNSPADDCII